MAAGTASSGARTGVVAMIQQFGSALNLNIHLHMLILDGVYAFSQNRPKFHQVGAPDAQTLERLLNRLIRRILRRLTVKNSALVRTDSIPKPFTANRDGFSLNCAVACQSHQRERLERLCRYITLPALCLERLSTNAAGQVMYQLKNPYRDGTTHVLFSPEDFIARLAALVPRPRINLTRYHGVFAPSSPMRREIVPTRRDPPRSRNPKDLTTPQATGPQQSPDPLSNSTAPLTAPLTWTQRRVTDH